MALLTVVSPGLKTLFERIGKPEIVRRPAVLRRGETGAVIACNHVGWADSRWMAYAAYPRQLRHMSKEELFDSPLAKWVLRHGGSIAIDRTDPAPCSIKTAVDVLQHSAIVLSFPSGTRKGEHVAFKRHAAAMARHARVPLVPAYYDGLRHMQIGHSMHRPRIRVMIGTPIAARDEPDLARRITHKPKVAAL
jgi:1-acyl-sn-glycerol-3-phosphate acyltransferase